MKKIFIMIAIFLLLIFFFLGCNPTGIEMKLDSNKQPIDWKEAILTYCDENDAEKIEHIFNWLNRYNFKGLCIGR